MALTLWHPRTAFQNYNSRDNKKIEEEKKKKKKNVEGLNEQPGAPEFVQCICEPPREKFVESHQGGKEPSGTQYNTYKK